MGVCAPSFPALLYWCALHVKYVWPLQVSTFLWENPQVALSAVHFRVPSTASSSGKGLSFVLQTNSSLQYFKGQYTDPNLHVLLPLQVAVERAIARLAVNGKMCAEM